MVADNRNLLLLGRDIGLIRGSLLGMYMGRLLLGKAQNTHCGTWHNAVVLLEHGGMRQWPLE